MDNGNSMRSTDTINRQVVTKHRTNPIDITTTKTVAEMLNSLKHISFQGRNLGSAFEVWQKMLTEKKCVIFFGLAGAMVPGGLRNVIKYLVQNRLIDIIVSTGANLFHDIYESLGHCHYKIRPDTNDLHLRRFRFDRMYDTAGDDITYEEIDSLISSFGYSLEKRPHTTREFFSLFGKFLAPKVKEDGIITSAYKAGVPIYSPSIADSGYGLSLFYGKKGKNTFLFDVIRDVEEIVTISVGDKYTTSEILIGGGVPKNFIQQGPNIAPDLGSSSEGYRYCIQIITDPDYWGGLSGCTFKEAQSWHKIHPQADAVTLHCDATIALPLLAAGLDQINVSDLRKLTPQFSFKEKPIVTFKP